jgi:transposase
MKTIRTSKHFIHQDLNTGKSNNLSLFLTESNRVLQLMINYIWNDGISWSVTNKKTGELIIKTCCPKHGHYDTANYFDYKKINIKTDLSARALSSLTSIAMGMISSAVKKHSKRLYQLEQLKLDPIKNAKNIARLENKINKNKPQKPIVKNQPIELSSKCATLIKRDKGEFNYFLKLQSLGKKYGKILIPIKLHKHANKLKGKGNLLGSFLISNDCVDFRWEIEVPEINNIGVTVGGDTGKNTILTLSNETSTDSKKDIHNHTLNSIIEKLSRKKKGSKSFAKAQKHRTHFINWSIKQVDWTGIKELRLEKVKNIFYKNSYSRNMSHWTNSEIETAIAKACESNGVHLIYQDSTYRSQRCSHCGLVRKSNRIGKSYTCKGCGVHLDADLNGAKNHAINLPDIPVNLRHLKLNRKGFYWKPEGLFHLDGSEIRVPNSPKDNQ